MVRLFTRIQQNSNKCLLLTFLGFSACICAVAESENSADPIKVNNSRDIAFKKDPVLIYREAGANEEQEGKIRQLAKDYEKTALVRIERLRNLSKQLRELSYETALDEQKILTLQNEINELQSGLNTERIKLMVKIRSQLSPEQNEKLVEIMKEREKQDQPQRGL